ncbi:MAG: GNAT family N-acetyltransferase, partial [Gammaproteobacteria bacterium]
YTPLASTTKRPSDESQLSLFFQIKRSFAILRVGRLCFLFSFVAVAESRNKLLGWVAAEERLLLETGARIEIVGLVVSDSSRRLGIGRALVGAAEEWKSRRGVSVIVVRSNIVRDESHPFYESLGFVRVKTQHVYSKGTAG